MPWGMQYRATLHETSVMPLRLIDLISLFPVPGGFSGRIGHSQSENAPVADVEIGMMTSDKETRTFSSFESEMRCEFAINRNGPLASFLDLELRVESSIRSGAVIISVKKIRSDKSDFLSSTRSLVPTRVGLLVSDHSRIDKQPHDDDGFCQ
jgi:hypothetical protein